MEIKTTSTVNLNTSPNLGQTTKLSSLRTSDRYLIGFTKVIISKVMTCYNPDMKSLPTFKFEKEYWDKDLKVIAGIDEVGRGALAGPVVAGCVIFKQNQNIEILIHDSKILTQKQREIANVWIKENSLSWGIGSATVSQINKFGIVKATEIAFRKAIKNTQINIDQLLIDAFYIPHVKGLRHKNQQPIIKGDSLSLSIAAASIIAKVHRDTLMTKLALNPKYKEYQWKNNKGYGTSIHREAIKKHGKTRLHRVSFLLKLS